MKILYKKQAVKYIERCDSATKARLKAAIEALPAGDITRLSGTNGAMRLRVGDLRVLFEMDDDTIIVKAVGSRGQIYKGL